MGSISVVVVVAASAAAARPLPPSMRLSGLFEDSCQRKEFFSGKDWLLDDGVDLDERHDGP